MKLEFVHTKNRKKGKNEERHEKDSDYCMHSDVIYTKSVGRQIDALI
jgi:hypothetical protein